MRTPNVKCCVCEKPLYRRPSDIKKYANFCCVTCRSEYYKTKPVSTNLELGRVKGKNNLKGIAKSEESKRKRSISLSQWCKNNPERLKQRGSKIRAENHYRWNGGVTRLNIAIRRMTENRRWSEAVRERDRKCQVCGSVQELESDHIVPFSALLSLLEIKGIEQARETPLLWDINNGITLCRKCHCKKDNRKYTPIGKGKRQRKYDNGQRITL